MRVPPCKTFTSSHSALYCLEKIICFCFDMFLLSGKPSFMVSKSWNNEGFELKNRAEFSINTFACLHGEFWCFAIKKESISDRVRMLIHVLEGGRVDSWNGIGLDNKTLTTLEQCFCNTCTFYSQYVTLHQFQFPFGWTWTETVGISRCIT